MFYRATTSASGSGLGLFIASEAVRKLNGAISFKTKYGEGSTFIIELPHTV
jgi:signal transduction histidine kinase